MCGLCRGSGNLFCAQGGGWEWYICPGCGGAGVRAMQGPAVYLRGGKKK